MNINSDLLKLSSSVYSGIILGAVNNVAFDFFIDKEFSQEGHCTRLPEVVYAYASQMGNLIGGISHDYPNVCVLIEAPIIEETVFRLAIQEILLKRVPERFIGRRFTSNKVAACARILMTSISFALVHATREEDVAYKEFCSLTRLGSTFVCGLIAGTIQEVTGNTLYSQLFHSIWNCYSLQ